MNILVTNDDGIDACGIKVLVNILKKFGNVNVVAPDTEKSAVGHGITMHSPLRVKEIKDYSENVRAWSVSGTPSDCVKIATENILDNKPDILFSGINNGGNLGTDVLYSGTVSAAVEGAINNIPSIAVSLVGLSGITSLSEMNYSTAEYFLPKIIDNILKDKDFNKSLLNINIPSVKNIEEIKEIKTTELGHIRYKNSFVKRVDPMGRTYYWMGGELEKTKNAENSDIITVQNKNISITPLQFDLTNYSLLFRKEKLSF